MSSNKCYFFYTSNCLSRDWSRYSCKHFCIIREITGAVGFLVCMFEKFRKLKRMDDLC